MQTTHQGKPANARRDGGKLIWTEAAVVELDAAQLVFGDYGPCRYAWRLANVRRLAEPIPLRGQQGLWPVKYWSGCWERRK